MGDRAGTAGLSGCGKCASAEGRKSDAADHVVEEITELRDGETDGGTKRGRSALGANLVVLVADGSEWLKVCVHEENVGALKVNKCGCDVRLVGELASAHNVLNALVKEFGGHDHAIGLTVIGNKFEYGSGRHACARLFAVASILCGITNHVI